MFDSPASAPVEWKVHLASAPEIVFDLLTTDRGRERFWAERSTSSSKVFTLTFPGGEEQACNIVAVSPPHHFAFRYFENTLVEFDLSAEERAGTDVALTEIGFKDAAHRT